MTSAALDCKAAGVSAPPNPLKLLLPFAAASAGVGFLSLMDAFMKEAALITGTYTATLLRALVGAAIIAPVWLIRRRGWPSRNALKLHMERGVISASMALSFFYALTKLPLAEAIAISFVAPLLTLYLARVLLGEEIQRKAIFASVLGFAGTLIIVAGRLGRDDVSADVWLGIASLAFSALLYAYNFVVIRRQSQIAGPVEIATFHSGVGGALLLLFAPFFATVPQAGSLAPIIAAGVLTIAASMSIAWAYARAEAQALVPFEYTGFLWASLFGWLFFREPVTLPTFAGTALIVTGCWIATKKPRKPAAAAST
ncbi:DMT family transporter [Erythrobacter sp. MTPC3]